MFRKILLSLCCSAVILSGAWGQKFITPADLDPATIIPPPPADSSPNGRADLDTVLHVQADCTPAQLARAKRVEEQSPFSFGEPVLGTWFTSRNLPHTAVIFDAIERQSRPLIAAAKRLWKRARPYDRDSRVQPSVSHYNSTSYPSGHAADAALWSVVLSAAFPHRATEFSAQVREVMWCRVIGGVHYPSDTEAGLDLGNAIGKSMLSSPDMKQALKTLRDEAAPYIGSSGKFRQSGKKFR